MKLALAFAFVAISIAVACQFGLQKPLCNIQGCTKEFKYVSDYWQKWLKASAGLTCITDEKKCSDEECCIKITNLMGRCAKLKQEDERCEMNPRKMLIKKHVYLRSCPCAPGMKCHAKDGLIGKVLGTCQEDSSEIVETEAPEPITEAPEEEIVDPEPEEPEAE